MTVRLKENDIAVLNSKLKIMTMAKLEHNHKDYIK